MLLFIAFPPRVLHFPSSCRSSVYLAHLLMPLFVMFLEIVPACLPGLRLHVCHFTRGGETKHTLYVTVSGRVSGNTHFTHRLASKGTLFMIVAQLSRLLTADLRHYPGRCGSARKWGLFS